MKFRIMSNNQWKCDDNTEYWAARGLDCSAAVREKGFARLYRETVPDVVGLQEVSPLMLDCLLRDLQAVGLRYAAVWGCDTPVLYRPDRLELVDSDFLVYPRDVPGLEGEFNNSDTKSYCVAVFRAKENGRMFAFMSTHLWWKSDDPASRNYQPGSGKARAYQIGIAIRRLEELQREYDIPQIVAGDFNTPYDSDPVRAALDLGFIHGYHAAVESRDETNGYHRLGPETIEPYTPGVFAEAIDHILVRNAPEGFVRRFMRWMPDYYLLLSDHAPVWIDAEL